MSKQHQAKREAWAKKQENPTIDLAKLQIKFGNSLLLEGNFRVMEQFDSTL